MQASLAGVLRDRIGPVVTFGDCLDVRAPYSVELGELAPDYDPSWRKDTTLDPSMAPWVPDAAPV